jgi:N-acyl amino acid synthase of PEP-CTERM/exosortase system
MTRAATGRRSIASPDNREGAMYLPDFMNLAVGFRKYFTAVPALTDALKHSAYRIRHDVYCRDLGYEPVRPDGIETDAEDAHSMQCLLRSNADGIYIGCIRLVLTDPVDPHRPLPIERLCAATIDRALVDPSALPRDRIAEVSRLAVVGAYRRRKGEAKRAAVISKSDFGTPDMPRFPYIPVGLYLGMIAQARQHGIERLFVLTEVRLAKHLSRLGVKVQRIGGPIEHRGARVPSMIVVNDVIAGFGVFVRPLFDVIAEQIEAPYQRVGRQRAAEEVQHTILAPTPSFT